jgi:hypothetical protein
LRITDSQFGALCTLRDFGPNEGEEILLPRGMDGTRKTRLSCNLMVGPMLSRMEAQGLIRVERGEYHAPKNAVGKSGQPRRPIVISITDKGRTALASLSTTPSVTGE